MHRAQFFGKNICNKSSATSSPRIWDGMGIETSILEFGNVKRPSPEMAGSGNFRSFLTIKNLLTSKLPKIPRTNKTLDSTKNHQEPTKNSSTFFLKGHFSRQPSSHSYYIKMTFLTSDAGAHLTFHSKNVKYLMVGPEC